MKNKKIILYITLIITIILVLSIYIIIVRRDKFVLHSYDNDDFYMEVTEENVILEDVRPYITSINFETVDIPAEVLQHIQNKQEFDITIKKYIYRNGLIDASKGHLEEYEIDKENGYIQMYFKLNNPEEKVIILFLDYNENIIEIFDYWGFDGIDEEE